MAKTMANEAAVAPRPWSGRDILVALGAVALLEALGAATGIAFSANADGWYAGLAKSALTPPGIAFAIVWPLLYALMALAAVRVWRRPPSPGRTRALWLFGAQLLLNYPWSAVFFGLHWIIIGALWVVALLLAVAATARAFAAVDRGAAWLLAPYLAWLCFAAYLSATIVVLNGA